MSGEVAGLPLSTSGRARVRLRREEFASGRPIHPAGGEEYSSELNDALGADRKE
jgi:hypothetical protein